MFQQAINLETGSVDPNSILYTDAQGLVWWVPSTHRYWVLYQAFLSAGNTPQPAA